MFMIVLDASDVIEALDEMQKHLAEFPQEMAEEVTQWQTQDMRRQYPNTELKDNTVETDIWSTSRTVDMKRKQARPVFRGRIKATSRVKVRGRGRARPILRPFLYDKLVERMNKLLEKLSWQ